MTSPSSTSSVKKAKVTDVVILMAGSGSRLRIAGENFLKPLIPIHERPLISYTINALASAGIKRIIAVVGFESDSMITGVKALIPRDIEIRFVENPQWEKQNGVSLLAAMPWLTAPFLLTMADHLFDSTIVDLLLREADLTRLNVAIDKKLDAVFDLDDAMKVQTSGNHVVAIGKNLLAFDAIDTGLFVCPTEIFDYLRRSMRNSDCSLADGVRLMARDDKAEAIDIGTLWWQDIDTPKMLEQAKAMTRSRAGAMTITSPPHRSPF
jgi:1L-myo-inositol 1-phosphate cytidylyltransferase